MFAIQIYWKPFQSSKFICLFSNLLTKINFSLSLGEKIKAKRKKDKLSAEELGVLLGVPKDRIYKWEKGAKPSDAEDLIKVQKWLNGELESDPNPGRNKMAIDSSKESMAKEILHLKAVVKAQGQLLAKMVADRYDRPVSEVMKELLDNTTLIMMDQDHS
jgi:transcriptional regulator with XRE-family HTH domain